MALAVSLQHIALLTVELGDRAAMSAKAVTCCIRIFEVLEGTDILNADILDMPAGFLDLIGRLFVRPPIEASHQPIILVHTVGTTQHKVRSATQREDLTVPGEEQLGIGLFIWILPTKDFLWAPLS